MVAVTLGKNIDSQRANRQLAKSSEKLSSAFERLSSGLRINRASDDAAGLSIASALTSSTRVYGQAIRNINDGISLLNISEGAISSLVDIVTRQKELAEQAANGVYGPTQRNALNKEAFALTKEYNRIIQSTSFNNLSTINGTDDSVTIQQGVGTVESTTINLGQNLGVAAGDGTFSGTITSNTTNSGTQEIQMVDMNGDGKLDAVLLHGAFTQGKLGVMLGNGDGTFQNESLTDLTSNFPSALSIGDLNGDGIPDTIVSYGDTTYTNVFLGNGDGTLRAGQSFTTGNSYRNTLVDINNDGVLDLLSVNDGIHSYIGNGDGTFRDGISLSIPYVGTAYAAAVSDLNGDGIKDLAFTDSGTNVGIYFGTNSGSFTFVRTIALSSTTGSVVAVDTRGNGVKDLLVTDNTGGTLKLLLGNGDGSFASATTILTGASLGSIITGDFNGDGIADVTVRNGANLNTLLGNGNGTFQAALTRSAPGNSTRGAGDVNGDGILDLFASASAFTSEIYVLLGNRDSTGRRNNLQSELDLTSIQTARSAIAALSNQLDGLTKELGNIGAFQSRLQTSSSTLNSRVLNYQQAASRITDVDVASEAADLVRNQILQQVGSAVLAQANQQSKIALDLLKE